MPRVSRAIAAFHPIFDEMLPGGEARFATVLGEIEQFGQALPRIPFRPSRSPARRVEVMADAFPLSPKADFVDNDE